MDDTSGVAPVISSQPAEQPPAESSPAVSPGASQPVEYPRRELKRRRKAYIPSWWRTRNRLGVRNWELLLIVFVALVAGVAATLGSSIMGVR